MLVGAGDLKPKSEEVEELGLVISYFTGFRSDVLVMQAMDVMVIPSFFEALGSSRLLRPAVCLW